MHKFLIEGGAKLSGNVTISGSKNSSLPILAASLLTAETCIIHRVPDVSDTNYMLQILRSLGAEVERASGTVTITSKKITSEAPYDLVRKMRASICVLGPLLARLQHAKVSLPGGCVIGDRPVDVHLKGFESLNCKINVEGGYMNITSDNIIGSELNLAGKYGSTVLGTGNIMMLATLAKGRTVIDNAACEPEVVDLALFLKNMGANISGEGTSRITIDGVSSLGGTDHEVIPDRIEAGTYLVAGAIASGEEGITLKKVNAEHLIPVINLLKETGFNITCKDKSISIKPGKFRCGGEIITEAYPGFPTDMQAQFCALFATTPGISVITEKIFPQRFMYVAELKRMGANIQIEGNSAIIHGVDKLSAAPIMASDLRASAALVLAALNANGQTEINRVYHIDRGYEHIDDKLITLGANIRRVKE